MALASILARLAQRGQLVEVDRSPGAVIDGDIFEALLLEHPAVADVAVIAKPNEDAGEVPKAFVVLKAGYENQSADELMAWVNGKLATFKNVREIEFIDTIPRNPSGKILRRVLKEQERKKMGLS